MYDPQAAFYGAYDRTTLADRPLLRFGRMQLVLGLAALILLVFVASDAYALAAVPVSVTVSSVTWATAEVVLAVSHGFAVHGGQTFTVSLSCATICYRFVGATVSAPFKVVAFHTELQPIQFTNVTIRAPSGSFTGPLTVTLGLPPLSDG